jgi:hypothetical protein
MRSILGYIFSLDSQIFSWASKRQEFVAQLLVETEYLVIAGVTS